MREDIASPVGSRTVPVVRPASTPAPETVIRTPSEGIDHLRPWLADIGAVEIWGPYEIRIEMYKPNAWVLRALAEIPILPYKVYDKGFAAGGKIGGFSAPGGSVSKARMLELEGVAPAAAPTAPAQQGFDF